MKKTVKIEGMSCGHCTAAVTKALSSLQGVSEANVSLEAKQAIVELSDDSVTDVVLKEAVEEAGFEVVGIL